MKIKAKMHARKPTLEERVHELAMKYMAECTSLGPSTREGDTITINGILDEEKLKALMLNDPFCTEEAASVIEGMFTDEDE